MRLLRNLCDSRGFGFRLTEALLIVVGRMLVHFALVFMKVEFVYAGSCSNFESLNVACLTFHDASHSLQHGLQSVTHCLAYQSQTEVSATCLTLKRTGSYSSDAPWAGLAQLVERAIRNRKVTSSTLVAGSSSSLLKTSLELQTSSCKRAIYVIDSVRRSECDLHPFLTVSGGPAMGFVGQRIVISGVKGCIRRIEC
jgi:hypothetical protein